MMMRLKNNKQRTTKSAERSSLMTTIREEDRTLGLRIIKISVSNPDTETRTIRHPINKLASTQIGTEIQTQIDSITKTDQSTLGTTDPTTVSRLSITSMRDQGNLILSTKKLSTEQQPTYTHLSSNYRRSGTRCSNYPIRFFSFKLLKSLRPDEESKLKSRFHMDAFYFPTGDSEKDSGLEIEFMRDTTEACSIINYRTFLEIAQFRQPITVVRSRQKTKTYTGDIVRMIVHTTLSFR